MTTKKRGRLSAQTRDPAKSNHDTRGCPMTVPNRDWPPMDAALLARLRALTMRGYRPHTKAGAAAAGPR